MLKGPAKFFLLPLAALFLGSCGLLEAEPYIEPVREADINRFLNDRATVNLGLYTLPPAFTHFAIFYRIYVSSEDIPATTTGTFSTISPALAADFNAISPFMDIDTMFGTNMHNVFSGRNFRYLTLAGADINAVLRDAIGNIVEFDFTHSQGIPVMRIGTSEHRLWRATGHHSPGLSFSPQPDRYFRNSAALRNRYNINLQFNADVADTPAAVADVDRRHTYVAMFIVAVGMDPATFANVYSTPSLIHVFQLPPG